ncbi:MAG: hypothetical protein Q9211_003328 [Gyalolechia sp. 1 TL-2023]
MSPDDWVGRTGIEFHAAPGRGTPTGPGSWRGMPMENGGVTTDITRFVPQKLKVCEGDLPLLEGKHDKKIPLTLYHTEHLAPDLLRF